MLNRIANPQKIIREQRYSNKKSDSRSLFEFLFKSVTQFNRYHKSVYQVKYTLNEF
jgi:hypothetical protein